LALGDEGKPAAVVDGREEVSPVGRKAPATVKKR
jgi:hypothetical protein